VEVDEPAEIVFSDGLGVSPVPSEHDGRGVARPAHDPILSASERQGQRDERSPQVVGSDGDPIHIALEELRPILSRESQSFSELLAGMTGREMQSSAATTIPWERFRREWSDGSHHVACEDRRGLPEVQEQDRHGRRGAGDPRLPTQPSIHRMSCSRPPDSVGSSERFEPTWKR
jgi:hypothetical protein